jgi:hypothetical protein
LCEGSNSHFIFYHEGHEGHEEEKIEVKKIRRAEETKKIKKITRENNIDPHAVGLRALRG